MFNAILVPIDAGEPSESAMEMAVQLASAVKGRLVFCSAIDVAGITVDAAGAFIDPRPSLDAAHEAAEKVMQDAAKRAADAGVAAETDVLDGDPVASILDAAREHHADLILMGSHGRGGLARAMLGSVTEGVLRKSSVPVLVVRTQRVPAHS
ncbi:MAG TPA: universal stress protein [Candidatus Dormibacteraeota bacterium]|nr:universal stress protein [Candidatus Dormibacteraeota bacterium]